MKSLVASVVALAACTLAPLMGQDHDLIWGGWTTRLAVEDVYDASADPLELKVYYYSPVDVASLDDEDIWVVSQNGYNELATFVRAERLNEPVLFPDEVEFVDQDGDFGVDGGGLFRPADIDRGGFREWIVATYHLPASADGWFAANNGRYTVLLEPDQVELTTGGFLPAALLGNFHVAVGQERPAYPTEVDIDIRKHDDGELFANVVYTFERGTIKVTDFGEVERHGNRLSIDFRAVHADDGEPAPVRFEYAYPLSDLESGRYTLNIRSGSRELVWTQFSVHNVDDPIEADIELDVQGTADGRYHAIVVVHFHDHFLAITDPGQPVLEGNRYVISATAKRAHFADEPHEPFWKWRYDLGVPEPGLYSLSFKINGQLCPHIEFKVGNPGPPIPASADIDIVRSEDKISAQVLVSIEPNGDGSIYDIGDWGQARLEGNTFYLDATSNGPLESFNTEPIHRSHTYPLLNHGGGEEWKALAFRKLEPIPEFLRPERREEVVIRTLEEWHAWIDLHWPPDIDADGPPVPVDFDTHMVVGVFLGDVIRGSFVEVHNIETNGQVVNVEYAEAVPGIVDDGFPIERDRPGQLVSLRKIDLPVIFNGHHPIDDWHPVKFETVELVPEWLRPQEHEEVVMRSNAEWTAWVEKHFPPNIFAPYPEPPVDLSEHTLIGVFLGEVEEGQDVRITSIEARDIGIRVNYLESHAGVQSEDPQLVRPGHMVAIPRTQEPVTFVRDFIAFPSPPPGGPDIDLPVADANGQVAGGEDDWPDDALFQRYNVVFRIDGHPYARTQFDVNNSGGGGRIPARASIDIEQGDASVAAQAEVAFTGSPYHSISEWGPVQRRGNHFILNSTAHEIQFVRESDLPYFERHTFRLPFFSDPDPGGDEPIDFEHVDARLQIVEPQNVIINSTQEWWDFIGFEPGPLVLPAPDPVDFDKQTLIGVFLGARPNGCYSVKITELLLQNGVINTYYQERTPQPGEICTQAIVYPTALVAIEKTDLPIDFIQLPESDIDPPIPVEPDGGIGDGAGEIPVEWVDGVPPLEPGDFFTVEFRINNLVYADAEFVYEGGGNGVKIPARATIDIEEGNASAAAHVEVAFTGFPYHTVSDWGPVLRRGDLFILDATASEVQFFDEPELPYFEGHTYRLPIYEEPPVGGELDFERIETHLQIEEPRNAVIQTQEDWWAFIGVEPGPLVDPLPAPVDLSEFTLIGVALGERPDTCYGVKILSGAVHDGGEMEITYKLREPREGEGCGDALTYPLSLVAIEKTQLPAQFIELPDDGTDDEPIPVEPNGGIGGGGDPFIPGHHRGRVITVEFRMNGDVYARTQYRLNDVIGLPNPTPLPDGFLDWLGEFVPEMNDPDAEAAAGGHNRDGDRWNDLEEFLLGLNPVDPSEPPTIRPEWITDEAGDHLAICFQRRKDAEAHADFVVEASRDLVNWIDDPSLLEHVSTTDLGPDLEEVTICIRATVEESEYPFLRLTLREKVVEE